MKEAPITISRIADDIRIEVVNSTTSLIKFITNPFKRCFNFVVIIIKTIIHTIRTF